MLVTLARDWDTEVRHMFREGKVITNNPIDWLAAKGMDLDAGKLCFSQAPLELSGLLTDDLAGIAAPRYIAC